MHARIYASSTCIPYIHSVHAYMHAGMHTRILSLMHACTHGDHACARGKRSLGKRRVTRKMSKPHQKNEEREKDQCRVSNVWGHLEQHLDICPSDKTQHEGAPNIFEAWLGSPEITRCEESPTSSPLKVLSTVVDQVPDVRAYVHTHTRTHAQLRIAARIS